MDNLSLCLLMKLRDITVGRMQNIDQTAEIERWRSCYKTWARLKGLPDRVDGLQFSHLVQNFRKFFKEIEWDDGFAVSLKAIESAMDELLISNYEEAGRMDQSGEKENKVKESV